MSEFSAPNMMQAYLGKELEDAEATHVSIQERIEILNQRIESLPSRPEVTGGLCEWDTEYDKYTSGTREVTSTRQLKTRTTDLQAHLELLLIEYLRQGYDERSGAYMSIQGGPAEAKRRLAVIISYAQDKISYGGQRSSGLGFSLRVNFGYFDAALGNDQKPKILQLASKAVVRDLRNIVKSNQPPEGFAVIGGHYELLLLNQLLASDRIELVEPTQSN
jgi:hypothetical protein